MSVAVSGMRRTAPAAGRFYVTLMAGYYNENFHVDMPQTFHTTDRRIALTRPLLHAELDYCHTQGITMCNFISPSQHGSITVIKRKKTINTNKQQYWKKGKNDILILHNQCLAYIIFFTPKSIQESILTINVRWQEKLGIFGPTFSASPLCRRVQRITVTPFERLAKKFSLTYVELRASVQ